MRAQIVFNYCFFTWMQQGDRIIQRLSKGFLRVYSFSQHTIAWSCTYFDYESVGGEVHAVCQLFALLHRRKRSGTCSAIHADMVRVPFDPVNSIVQVNDFVISRGEKIIVVRLKAAFTGNNQLSRMCFKCGHGLFAGRFQGVIPPLCFPAERSETVGVDIDRHGELEAQCFFQQRGHCQFLLVHTGQNNTAVGKERNHL